MWLPSDMLMQGMGPRCAGIEYPELISPLIGIHTWLVWVWAGSPQMPARGVCRSAPANSSLVIGIPDMDSEFVGLSCAVVVAA